MVSKTDIASFQLASRQLSQQGHTLLEMIIVVALLGLIAAVAMPSAQPTNLQRLALSASELGDAFRFARTEAQRTHELHGVSIDTSAELIRVFRIDAGSDPDVRVFDVRHPITKQLYTLQIGVPPYADIDVLSVSAIAQGTCSEPQHISFDATGVTRCSLPVSSRLQDAQVVLASGGSQTTVSLDSYTGRVTTQ